MFSLGKIAEFSVALYTWCWHTYSPTLTPPEPTRPLKLPTHPTMHPRHLQPTQSPITHSNATACTPEAEAKYALKHRRLRLVVVSSNTRGRLQSKSPATRPHPPRGHAPCTAALPQSNRTTCSRGDNFMNELGSWCNTAC